MDSLFSFILYFIIAILLGVQYFVSHKLFSHKKQFNDERERFLQEKLSVEREHSEKIEVLLQNSQKDIELIQNDAIGLVKEAGAKLQEAEAGLEESNSQIQQMYQYIDSLIEIINELSESYESLKDYSFEVHERLVEFNLSLMNMLRGGFLEDNEEVRELVNQIRKFLQDSQDIQDRYVDLFLEEEDESVSLDEDIELSMEEFFDEDYEADEQEETEKIPPAEDTMIEPNFKIKRNYQSDKYE